MQRIISGPKRDEMTEGQRKLHSVELHYLYCLPNIGMIMSQKMKWIGHVACMGVMKIFYKILVGKPQGKRDRHTWEDGIRTDLKETGWGDVAWIHVAQDTD
jgi:hypothetical protein